MATKAKKRVHPMPKLGWLDQCIYWAGMAVTFGIMILSLFIPVSVWDSVAFSDDRVIARTAGPGNLFFLNLCFWCAVACILIAAGPYRDRTPIFGRKDIRYGPPAYPRIYPLLMKNKPTHWVSPKAAARKKKWSIVLATFLISTFLFSAIVYPMSFYGRSVLLRDGSVAVYNSFNQEKEHYYPKDIDAMTVRTRYASRRGGGWRVEMIFKTSDGEKITYSMGSFKGNVLESLQNILMVRERYGDLVTIEGRKNLERVADRYDMTAGEKAILYQIFSNQG